MRNKKKFSHFMGYSATNGLSALFVLIIIAMVIVVVYASTSISPYRDKGHLYSLKEDLKNAHKVAQTCFTADPKSIIVSEEQLKSKGWLKSDKNLFISADMTLHKGQVVLQNEYLAKQPEYAPGIGSISFNGTIVLPIKTSDAKVDN